MDEQCNFFLLRLSTHTAPDATIFPKRWTHKKCGGVLLVLRMIRSDRHRYEPTATAYGSYRMSYNRLPVPGETAMFETAQDALLLVGAAAADLDAHGAFQPASACPAGHPVGA